MSYSVSTTYPNVIKLADPLLVRISEFSILVGNTNFWAKRKYGIQYKGYGIYVSGIDMPILEVKFEDNELNMGMSGNVTEDVQKSFIDEKAKLWIDDLEEKLAVSKSDSEIKKAIDRLCWQLHYDVSNSNYDMTSLDGFSDVAIDKSTGYGLTTIPNTMQSTAYVITGHVEGQGSTTYGSLYDISSKLQDFENSMSTVMGTINSTVVSVGNYTNKIATNLRADNSSEYTISKALRDADDSIAYGGTVRSVSCSVKLQTDLESESFNEISVNQLGAFGTTNSHRSLYDAIGSYAQSGSDSVSNTLTNLETNIGDNTDTAGNNTVFARLSQVSDQKLGNFADSTHRSLQESLGSYTQRNSSSLSDIIGTNQDGSSTVNTGTLFYEILHRAGTRNLNTAVIESDSAIGRVLDAVGSSSSSSTINTINTNVSTLLTRIGTSSTANSLWYDVANSNTAGSIGEIYRNVNTLVNKIGTASTAGTVWYDVLNNACKYPT